MQPNAAKGNSIMRILKFSSFKTVFVFGPSVAAGLTVFSAGVSANTMIQITSCTTYTNDAVAAANANIAQNCGFSDGRWTTSFEDHFNWCIAQPQDAMGIQFYLADENKARADGLASCQRTNEANASNERSRCTAYSEQAVAYAELNVSKNCGFTGDRWSRDFQTQLNLCYIVPQEKLEFEAQRRVEGITKCDTKSVAPPPPIATTNDPFVCLYVDNNFAGAERCFDVAGKGNIAATRANAYSSVTIAPGFKITLFDEPNQRGKSCTFSSTTKKFKSGCNDMAESVLIQKR